MHCLRRAGGLPAEQQDILGPEQGARLEGVLSTRKAQLSGIVNGVDAFTLTSPLLSTTACLPMLALLVYVTTSRATEPATCETAAFSALRTP